MSSKYPPENREKRVEIRVSQLVKKIGDDIIITREDIKVYKGDCLDILKSMDNSCIDLVVTDPPYLIATTKRTTNSKNTLTKQMRSLERELLDDNLTDGYDPKVLDELVRIMKNINIYVWCNAKQIPMYIDFFIKKHQASFDIIIWNKTNAMPLYSNRYLSDKEYCLYFRKRGLCKPATYQKARTVYYLPVNQQDKRKYGHPTIKPLPIIRTLIENSSLEGDTILDCFLGSGTTGVASVLTSRKFIGIEIQEKYYNLSIQRINEAFEQIEKGEDINE